MSRSILKAQPNSPDALNVASYLDRCDAQGRNPENAEVAAACEINIQRVRRIRESLKRLAPDARPHTQIGDTKAAMFARVREDWTPELRKVEPRPAPEDCEGMVNGRRCASIYPVKGARWCKPCEAALDSHHAARRAATNQTVDSPRRRGDGDRR